MDKSLIPFFRPEGVAVVGVSTSPLKLGYGIARNLNASGYTGAIHFVGQRAGRLWDRPIHSGLSEVPEPVDLAVLAIPASAVPAAIDECAARGIRAVIVISAGFREAGDEGAALEQQCLELAHTHGMRLLGPNCIGIADTHLPLDTSFLQPPMPPSGGIGFVSQSGAFCAAVIDWSRRQGLGFSQIVSLGNQADLNETDMLAAVAENEQTRVIALYMEGVSNGGRFVAAAREITRHTPVVALKVGRSRGGQKAVSSHTAAMAGTDAAFDAAFERSGILRAGTTEELFDWARALEHCQLPAGPAVAILTDAGGPGVIAADALEAQGLHLASLSAQTQRACSSRLPEAASVSNPVDMLASASPDDYSSCLRLLLADGGVNAALVILPPPPMYAAEAVAAALVPVIQESTKPVVVALLGSELTAAAFEVLGQARVPTYPFPERGVGALAALYRRAQYLRTSPAVPAGRPFDVPQLPAASPDELLCLYGIACLPVRLATSPEEAAAAARDLGFPVVMKIASEDIIHKSEANGVLLNLANESQVMGGYTQLVASARHARPDAVLAGVHLQPHIIGGQEVIIGAVRDPQFGPLVMFGSGGIETEALGDVAFALAPLDSHQADKLIDRTWAGRRLNGFRSLPPVDRAAAREALMRLSWLALEHPEIGQVEINPLRVLAQGAWALDVRFGR